MSYGWLQRYKDVNLTADSFDSGCFENLPHFGVERFGIEGLDHKVPNSEPLN